MSKKLLLMSGSVHQQAVKCGKPNCRCAKGEKHGAYFYRFWWEGGRVRKEYIKRGELDRVRRACAAYRHERQQQREALRQFTEVSKMLRAMGL